MRRISFLFAFIAATLTGAAMAQEQEQTKQSAAATTVPAHPARGATMESVRAKFGTPSQEIPAVGKPPISRWEYPGYVVYFENDRVLHTVIAK
jgi:hypothetical protein